MRLISVLPLLALIFVIVGGAAAQDAETTPEPGMFLNPVLDRDFPDPDVLRVGDTFYAYATNALGMNIQVARSTDLVEWEFLFEALPRRPYWAVPQFGYAWAPEVTTFDGGETFTMIYVVRYDDGEGGRQCLAVATSPTPEGPFTPDDEGPFVCQLEDGGSIDPAVFFDDGTPYLLWKNDGNAIGIPTWIYIQQLSDDGLTLLGEPTPLITADQGWEGTLVEAPTLWRHEDQYLLFYSANSYGDGRYAMGYAVADDLLGPYEKTGDPILETSIPNGIVGPGGQDIVTDDADADWLVFHGWAPNNYRRLYLAPLVWDDGVPRVVGPINRPLPRPTFDE